MMGILGGLFGGVFKWLLGMLTGKAKPGIEDYAASDARAKEQLGQQEAANEITTKASAARNAAADELLRIGAKPHPDDAATKADIAKRFPDDFRD